MSRSRGVSIELRSVLFNTVIEKYGQTLRWVLKHQTATLVVTVGTLVLTLVFVLDRAQRVFPGAGYGRDPGHFGGAAEYFVCSDVEERQQELAKVILKDPDVESLSSFIGIDGTNVTSNSGRIQINLKPRDERKQMQSQIIRRLQPKLNQVPGITLYHAAGAGSDRGGSRQPHAISVQPGRRERQGTRRIGCRVYWKN